MGGAAWVSKGAMELWRVGVLMRARWHRDLLTNCYAINWLDFDALSRVATFTLSRRDLNNHVSPLNLDRLPGFGICPTHFDIRPDPFYKPHH
jgi:hypothetical protein